MGPRASLYAITEDGRPLTLGTFHFLSPRGCYLEPKHPKLVESIFPDVPYFLDDMRPSGFLGRLIPRAHPELAAPLDILTWTGDDCFRYWALWGSNLIGNLIIGERALQRHLESHQSAHLGDGKPVPIEEYPDHARHVLSQGDAGSSAGGEQPKFILEATSSQPAAIVKFSPPTTEPIGKRVADLLVCESLCHEVLRSHRITSAKSTLIQVKGQVFLRVERFDRVGLSGRRGLISLRALSLEFVGTLDSWSKIGHGLLQARKISEESRTRIRQLELFGELIGNTDMHAGNFSFFMDSTLRLREPAPVYDMLPMMYYPRQNQLMEREYRPRLPVPEEADLWKKASALALELWQRAARDKRISKDFREVAARNAGILQKQMELATRLF